MGIVFGYWTIYNSENIKIVLDYMSLCSDPSKVSNVDNEIKLLN